MHTSNDLLAHWLSHCDEGVHLEFKEAKQQYDTTKLMRYCVALANEGGGKLVLGVSDRKPRHIVGSLAFQDLQEIRRKLLDKLRFRVDVEEVLHDDGRVVVFHIPSRPPGAAYHLEGAYWMRSGEDLQPMTDDRLRAIHAESDVSWLEADALTDVAADTVIALLDTQSFFDLIHLPYPAQQSAVLDRLRSESLIRQNPRGWSITRMAALLFAKKLGDFPALVARKAIRVFIYEGNSKQKTRADRTHNKGYASDFDDLIDFIHDAAPSNHLLEETIRKDIKMFSRQAIRELIVNAMVHQDFSISGAGVMIELYSDRLEFSNPGKPSIPVERFIDEYRSRNEKLADLMRRMGLCEEKGSGIDKVVFAAETLQLPAPDFRTTDLRTTSILFAHQDFMQMGKTDRIRACYQHCCLMYVSNQRMTNQSLRERFNLAESKAATVSQIISATLESGHVRLDDSETSSRRYAKYLPWWA